MTEDVNLGSQIILSGFSGLDSSTMVVLRKMVGNYARRYSEISEKFEKLHITMKPVHERKTSEIYEIHAKVLANGKPFSTESEERNLFVGIDDVLKKLENLLAHHQH